MGMLGWAWHDSTKWRKLDRFWVVCEVPCRMRLRKGWGKAEAWPALLLLQSLHWEPTRVYRSSVDSKLQNPIATKSCYRCSWKNSELRVFEGFQRENISSALFSVESLLPAFSLIFLQFSIWSRKYWRKVQQNEYRSPSQCPLSLGLPGGPFLKTPYV